MKPWFYRQVQLGRFLPYVKLYPASLRGFAFVAALGLLCVLVWFKAADLFGGAFMLGGLEISTRVVLIVGIALAGIWACWRLSEPDPHFVPDPELNPDEENKDA